MARLEGTDERVHQAGTLSEELLSTYMIETLCKAMGSALFFSASPDGPPERSEESATGTEKQRMLHCAGSKVPDRALHRETHLFQIHA